MRIDKDGKLVSGEFGAERGFVWFCRHGYCANEATHDFWRKEDKGEFFRSSREFYCEFHAPEGSKLIDEDK